MTVDQVLFKKMVMLTRCSLKCRQAWWRLARFSLREGSCGWCWCWGGSRFSEKQNVITLECKIGLRRMSLMMKRIIARFWQFPNLFRCTRTSARTTRTRRSRWRLTLICQDLLRSACSPINTLYSKINIHYIINICYNRFIYRLYPAHPDQFRLSCFLAHKLPGHIFHLTLYRRAFIRANTLKPWRNFLIRWTLS